MQQRTKFIDNERGRRKMEWGKRRGVRERETQSERGDRKRDGKTARVREKERELDGGRSPLSGDGRNNT